MKKLSKILIDKNGTLTSSEKKVSRESILNFENILKNSKGAQLGDCFPLKHTFSEGIYIREIFIPKGQVVVGKIHKHEHPNFLLKGEVVVVTEDGEETIDAPCSMISNAGTKRVLYAKTDLIWITVHNNPTNTKNLYELEKMIIAKDYNKYDSFVSSKKSLKNKLRNFIIKTIS